VVRKSSPFREAGALNRKLWIHSQRNNTAAKIITLGDLNDGPLIIVSKKALGAIANKSKCPAARIYNL
jgi:hypothetical protein